MLGDREWAVTAPQTAAPDLTRPAAPRAPFIYGPGLSGVGTGAGSALSGGTVRVPLGRVVGARSGDKAGNATLGLWARDDATHAWLAAWLTADRLRELVPEAARLELRRWALPNLRAAGFTLVGLLGRGAAASLRLDPQAKGLAEYIRAKHVEIPVELVPATVEEE